MAWLAHVPHVDADTAVSLAHDLYDVAATAEALASERDQNFLLTTTGGDRLVLKIANATDDRELLEAQNDAMTLVARAGVGCPIARQTRTGERIATVTLGRDRSHFVRLLTYVPGVPLAHVTHPPLHLWRDLGRVVGRADRALAGFEHPALHRTFHWDLVIGRETCRARVDRVAQVGLRGHVERVLADTDALAPVLARLPRAVIHNDANDHNVIVSRPARDRRDRTVTGLIDFGDIVHSYAVGGLAVAIAYAVLDRADPLAVAAAIVAGYHAERSLQDDELAALFGLVRLRLAMSACVAAEQTAARPGDDYLLVSQAAVARTLPALGVISSRLAEYTFRAACAFGPVPDAAIVTSWLARHAHDAAPVLGHDLRRTPTTVLDLSVASPIVSGDERENAEPVLTPRILAAMAASGATIGVGRYGEARLLYSTPLFASGTSADAQQRTIHLGVDLFADAGTPVFAALDGVVHAVARNPAPLDYGTVVILEHEAESEDGSRRAPFFTIYGHLAPDALTHLRAGQTIDCGARLGALGTAAVNGGWTPHLHFQLALDLVGRGTDFPGVALAAERDMWLAISPDPSALLHVHGASALMHRHSTHDALTARQTHIGPNVRLAYSDPIRVARGWMQYLYDDDGRRYLDAYNNVPHVGHAHPRVVRAAADQLRVLNTNTRYLHDSLATFAARLTATLPPPLSVCYFVNSGSEANDLALRLARAHTQARDVIVLDAAYHGITTTLIDVSPYKYDGPGGDGRAPWVHAVPLPDTYRGPCRRDDHDAGRKYAAFVADVTDTLTRDGTGVAAFLAESCPSVGGQIVPPDGYLAAAYAAVRAAGGICIADEVQTGYGRLGTHFWGFERQQVIPDIVVLGKPIGNGYPIGAVVTTPEIAASFDNGMELFSTFGGSTVSCAVGLAVLETVIADGLQAHARRVGDRLLSSLGSLAADAPLIGDVRGSGLFLGIELVRDRGTQEPASTEASIVVDRLRDQGILIGTDGPFHNVLKIRPPMPFDDGDADRLVAALRQALCD